MDWRGKRVVIAGMGAFAVENVRTALEQGAAEAGGSRGIYSLES